MTPTREGFFWARQIASDHLDPDELAPDEWEPVLVFDNNGSGEDEFRVFVLGRDRSEACAHFVWGDAVADRGTV